MLVCVGSMLPAVWMDFRVLSGGHVEDTPMRPCKPKQDNLDPSITTVLDVLMR